MTSALYLFKIVIGMKNPTGNDIQNVRNHFRTEFERLKKERRSPKYYTGYFDKRLDYLAYADSPDINLVIYFENVEYVRVMKQLLGRFKEKVKSDFKCAVSVTETHERTDKGWVNQGSRK